MTLGTPRPIASDAGSRPAATDIVQRLRHGVYGVDRIPLCAEAAATITALRAQVTALEQDAARYRWLRHGDNDEICIEIREGANCYGDDVWLLRMEKLDAVIDAAMEK